MNIIGLNSGITRFGKKLKDGGTCLISNGSLVSVILEERITRIKQDGGYSRSLEVLLHSNGLRPIDIDAVAYSTCCEAINSDFSIDFFRDVPVKYIPVNHHISHAYSVFSLCPFNEAIIIVIDAGGNVLTGDDEDWWKNRREQHSYYIATKDGIDLIETDFDDSFETGFAEAYRAFTHYLGWGSSQYAGKVMALAAYGENIRFAGKHLFSLSGNKLISICKNNPKFPIEMLVALFKKLNIEEIPIRDKRTEILDAHQDLAYWIQTEMEEAFFAKIDSLIQRTGIRNICFAGGVGYNCKMNGKALRHPSIERFFVTPASGDHGQCVGNAFFALHKLSGKLKRFPAFTPYIGSTYNYPELDKKLIDAGLEIVKVENMISETAKLIADGEIVAWYNGRSEFGPRALGNRSLLADPRNASMKFRMNSVKSREPFMPFGPSVIDAFVSEYFLASQDCRYMTHAVNVHPHLRKKVPAVVHADGTSRIHTVTKDENHVYYDLINAFYEITGVPMILNTSFNRSGEPIVDSPEDAISAFMNLDIQYMTINGILARKPHRLVTTSIPHNEGLFIYPEDDAVSKIQKNINPNRPLPFFKRKKINLNKEFVKWLYYGKKITTVRYKKGGIGIPESFEIPMFATPQFEKDLSSDDYVGVAEISKYQIKRFSDLDGVDAINDGFQDVKELRATLFEIYGDIPANEYVTIYYIYLNHRPFKSMA